MEIELNNGYLKMYDLRMLIAYEGFLCILSKSGCITPPNFHISERG